MVQVRTSAARVVAGCALALGGVAGCTVSEGPQAAGDCQSQVRLDGRVYTGWGFTRRDATRFAMADRAECHDNGRYAVGSVFTDDPAQVAVWSFDGYDTELVVGVRSHDGPFEVFVADSVARDDRDRIIENLSRGQRHVVTRVVGPPGGTPTAVVGRLWPAETG